MVNRNPAFGRREFVFAALAIAAVLFATYSPVLTHSYGYSDDYFNLVQVAGGSLNFRPDLQQGRPLLSLFFSFFSLATSVDTLNRVRLLGLAGVLLFALTSYNILRRSGQTVLFSLALSLLVCLSPGFALCAGWATIACHGYMGALSLAGGAIIWSALGEKNRLRAYVYAACGIVFLLAVDATFQPLGGFAVLPILALSSKSDDLNWESMRKFAFAILILLFTAVLYYLAYQISIYAMHLGGLASRAALPADLAGKARYLGKVLWSGATNWGRFYGHRVQLVVGVVVIAACCFGCADRSRGPWLCGSRLLCCAVGVVFTILPIAAVRENSFAFRTQTELDAVVCLLFMLGLSKLFDREERRWKAPALWRWGAYGLLVLGVAVVSHHLISSDFVDVNAHEMSVLSGAVRKINSFPDDVVYIVPALTTEKSDALGEFGCLSSAQRWVTRAMLELLFVKEYEPNVPLRIALARHRKFQVKAGPVNGQTAPIINGFEMLQGKSTRVLDPYWGEIEINRNGWCFSRWFGVFDNRRFPWIFHSELGWLRCKRKEGSGYWFFSNQAGAIWTSPKCFPYVYSAGQKAWLLLSRNIWVYGPIYPGCLYYNLKKKTWSSFP